MSDNSAYLALESNVARMYGGACVVVEADDGRDAQWYADLSDELALHYELLRLEREAEELRRQRLALRSPWWVRLLRWFLRTMQ